MAKKEAAWQILDSQERSNISWLIGGLGPGGLDSDWIPENERDGCLESQTTGPQTPV